MQKELNRICEQFVENRKRFERAFPMSSRQLYCASALLLCMDDCDADLSAIRRGKRLLQRHTAPLSTFRGFGMMPIAGKLSARENGLEWIQKAKENLRILKKAGFPATDYLCLAAMLMTKSEQGGEAIAAKAREIYQDMRHAHRVLTANENVCMAVLLAMYTDPAKCLKATEIAFEKLQDAFGMIHPIQMASQTIGLLEENASEAADRTVRLYNRLREQGIRAKTHTELSILAFLACSGKPEDEIVSCILECMQYLRNQKGYSALTLGRNQRLLFACCLEAIHELGQMRDTEQYLCRRDVLQCTMLLTVLLSVVQSIAGTAR